MKKNTDRTARRGQIRRITQINELIRKGGFPNCVQMADELKVSVKTIARDIDFIRDELEWPIEYDERRKGFYFRQTESGSFTTGIGVKEVHDLIEANAAITQYLGTSIEKLMREAF